MPKQNAADSIAWSGFHSLIGFEVADEVPEDGVSDGLALVWKALTRPGNAALYQCEQWIVFAGVCKPVHLMTCCNS